LRELHPATLLPNGQVRVAGGAQFGEVLASAELYPPAPGRWTATDKMNTEREFHTATLLPNGRVLVAGGFSNDVHASAELYDPATELWTATGQMTTAREGH